MRLAIIGSRSFDRYALLESTMDDWFAEDRTCACPVNHIVTGVVSGGARGADTLAARWATERGVPLTELKPDWDKHGKAAGFLRNKDIVEAADMVLAFWGNGADGQLSRGTQHSIGVAKRLRKPTLIVYV